VFLLTAHARLSTSAHILHTAACKSSISTRVQFHSAAQLQYIHSLYRSYFDVYTELIGKEDSCSVMGCEIEMKTNKELYQLAERSKNINLMQQVALNQMCVHCYFREYQSCAKLTENYQVNNTPKRSMDSMVIFYSGICEFCAG
jgi:hypothetical protein